jgi:four helix bundle protein
MARDHRKLRVFHASHQLILSIYKETAAFPRDEWFGLRAQIRRAAVSIACNIVEGNARRTVGEYVHFLNIARASASELEYLIGLANELGYLGRQAGTTLTRSCNDVIPQMEMLLQRMERERRTQRTDHRLETRDYKFQSTAPRPTSVPFRRAPWTASIPSGPTTSDTTGRIFPAATRSADSFNSAFDA